MSEQDRLKTAVGIQTELAQNYNVQVTSRTVRNRLKHFGLIGRTARQKPFVSEEQKGQNRVCQMDCRKLEQVLFFDESKFNKMRSDGK